MKHLNEIAICNHGIKGVIKYFDENNNRYVGHRLDNPAKYWQSVDPKFTGMKLVDKDKVPKQ